MTLDASGDVNLTYGVTYGSVAASGGIVGVTDDGGGADSGETDLSAGGPFSVNGTTYEQFPFSDAFDLDGQPLDFQ